MKKVTVFEDKQDQEVVRLNIERNREVLQSMIEAYNKLNLPEIDDFGQFMSSPAKYIDHKFEESVQPPAGMKKDMYLKMLERSDTSEIEALRQSVNMINPGLWVYEDGKVTADKAEAEKLIHSKTVEVVEGSP